MRTIFKNRYLFATSLDILVFRALFLQAGNVDSLRAWLAIMVANGEDIKNNVQAMELSVLVDLGIFSPLGEEAAK